MKKNKKIVAKTLFALSFILLLLISIIILIAINIEMEYASILNIKLTSKWITLWSKTEFIIIAIAILIGGIGIYFSTVCLYAKEFQNGHHNQR